MCSNSSLGRAILERDVPLLAKLFPVVSLWARFCNTFVAQVWRSDASVLLLFLEFPHGRNLLVRATKLLRDSLHVTMGQLALFAAREQLIDQSASLIFVQILSYCPRCTSNNGHGDQSMGRHFTGDTFGALSAPASGAAVGTCVVLNRQKAVFTVP